MTSAQHLNLIDEALRPRRARASSADGLRALAVLLALAGVACGAGRLATDGEARRFERAQRQLLALQPHTTAAALAAPGAAMTAELAMLQRRVEADAQVRSVIAGGAAGRAQGYSPYLLALARQARHTGPLSLWITGLTISGESDAIDLHGRTTDPRLLPEYLGRLDEEPLFRGRAFAQMTLRATSPIADDAPIVEFSLHANAQPTAGAPPPALTGTGGLR
jgi:hypothetical protein